MRTLKSIRASAGVVGPRVWAIGALALVGVLSTFGAGVITARPDTPAAASIARAAKPEKIAAAHDRAGPGVIQGVPDFRLRGVLHGRRPLANIDGEVVGLGATFDADGATYTVRAIAGKTVTLTDPAGNEIVLHIGGRKRAALR